MSTSKAPALGDSMGSDRIHALNLLRIGAFLMVVLSHGFLHTWVSHIPERFDFGGNGVSIFFVLSGFLITRSLLGDRASRSPLRRFFIRRSLRILPTYFLVLCVYAIISPTLGRLAQGWGEGPRLSEWLYTANFAYIWSAPQSHLKPVWSLCVEEHFYCIWPFLVFWLSAAQIRRVVLFVFPAIAAASLLVFQGKWSAGAYLSSTTQFMLLGFGGLIAYHERWARSRQAIEPAIAILALGIVSHGWAHSIFDPTQLVAGSMLGVGAILFSLSVVEPMIVGRPLLHFVQSKPVQTLAMMTYSAYLIHYPIFQWFQVPLSDLKTSLDSMYVIFALSLVTTLLWEQHWIALGRWLTTPRILEESSPLELAAA
jgi:peptidoglycan/LPS O-acetylase OafA/YrhL